ncbi:MAG: hypothetical protein R3A52_29020 [Polyangiales bacterium]
MNRRNPDDASPLLPLPAVPPMVRRATLALALVGAVGCSEDTVSRPEPFDAAAFDVPDGFMPPTQPGSTGGGGGDAATSDAANPTDAGTPADVFRPDTGVAPDVIPPMPPPTDGGVNTDSGVINTDAGSVDTDSGVINTDAGSADTDSGVINTDAGTVDTDTGFIPPMPPPPVDAGI